MQAYQGQNKDQNIKSDWFTRFPVGNDQPGVRHWRDDNEKQLPVEPGWSETSVVYKFNSWYYRGELEPGTGKTAAFGCSFTFGTGVNNPWPELLGVVNCGQPGSSNDKIARLVLSYCNQFQPSEIYVMWTFPQRREWIDERGNVITFKNITNAEAQSIMKQPFVSWDNSHLFLMNNLWDSYNYQKNHLLVENYCAARSIKLHDITVTDLDHRNYPPARDRMHPGPDWHINIASLLS
jgi:hypothetical protein